MSELIDRIFDSEKISAEINTILSGLKNVESSILGVSSAVSTLEKGIRKAKSSDDLAASSAKLNNEFVKGQKAMKTWEDEVAKLNEKTKQLTETEKAGSIEIAKARLELQAAQKATKEAAIAEIELTSKTKDLSGSYNALQKDLSNSMKAYKALSGEEAKSAKGRELLKKIGETQSALKATDAKMGNYQRNVGNYVSALEGLTPKIGGLAGTLMDIAKAAKASRDDLNEMGGDNGLGIMANHRIPAGLATIMTGIKGVGQAAIAMGKAFLANPIGAVLAAIAAVFVLVNSAIKENGQATEKLGQVMAPFKVILALVLNIVGKMVVTFLDGVLAFAKFGNAVMSLIPGLDTLAAKNKQAIELEKEKQRLIREGIVDKAYDAKEELRIAELKKQIMEKQKYSTEERLAMAKEVDRAEKAMALDDADRANKNLKTFLRDMKLKGKIQKDYTIEELQQLTDLQAAKYAEQQKYFDRTKKLASREASLNEELAADQQKANEEAASKEKERQDNILAARRRLIDSQLSIMADGEDKALKVSAETYSRQIEDLRKNGELTKELKANIEKAAENEQDKIKAEWEKKRKDDAEKTEKELLDIELKRIEGIQKGIEKQTEILSAEYAKQERDLKKKLSDGLITQDDYQKELSKIQLDGLLDVNNKTIASLQKLLTDSKLTDDKRAELSAKLAQLQIDNENAVVDATIKANDDKVKADEDAKAKRVAVVEALANATGEIFGAIADFATMKSEQRIAELEKEQQASDEAFEKSQSNLDNALMSDETRAAKQQELNDKKAASDKVIQDKIQAEKIKQAKWDKANAIVQAIITTGLAVLNASLTVPFIPMGLIAAGLATTMGAIQVATIASQPIPAYEHGTENHPGGLSLWGEKRAEVAVLPSGKTFLAEKPTLTNFDAGTKIYDSVQAYENAMGKQSIQQITFDYDKFGEKLKPQNIYLDSRGLWGIVSQQNSRRTLINRRYSIGK